MPRLTNAQMLKLMLDINNKYAEEHPEEEELLRENTKAYIESVLKKGAELGNDPAITNLLFNKNLKGLKK